MKPRFRRKSYVRTLYHLVIFPSPSGGCLDVRGGFNGPIGLLVRAAGDSNNMTYKEQLKSPLWQRRRLEIMERDKFRCLRCGNEKETLNVHHLYYESGLSPWEYPEWSLITLCRTHHKDEEAFKTQSDWSLVESFRRLGADNRTLNRFAQMLNEISTHGKTPGSALYEIDFSLSEIWTRQTWRNTK